MLYVLSATVESCALYGVRKCRIVSASAELCALYCLHKRGIVM